MVHFGQKRRKLIELEKATQNEIFGGKITL